MPPQPGPPYEWDEPKSRKNFQDRGFGFDIIQGFDWSTAYIDEDVREDYGEDRWISVGLIDRRLYVTVWTPRPPATRIISLREADDDEAIYYAQSQS